MYNKETLEATNRYLKMCMSINGAISGDRVIRISDDEHVIVKIPKNEFTYLKLCIASDENNPIVKFYKCIDEKTISVHNVWITY